jgi:hypothetical protein
MARDDDQSNSGASLIAAQLLNDPHYLPTMALGDSRITDREMASINAAAVVKEYRVQPHLGERARPLPDAMSIETLLQTIGRSLPLMGACRSGHFWRCLNVMNSPLVVLDNVKVRMVTHDHAGLAHLLIPMSGTSSRRTMRLFNLRFRMDQSAVDKFSRSRARRRLCKSLRGHPASTSRRPTSNSPGAA